MFFSVDRVIGTTAVLMGEDSKPLEVPLQMLPQGVKNGDMLFYENGQFTIDSKKTEERRGRMAEMLAKLLNNREE